MMTRAIRFLALSLAALPATLGLALFGGGDGLARAQVTRPQVRIFAQVQTRQTPPLTRRATPVAPVIIPGITATRPATGTPGRGRVPGKGSGGRGGSTPGASVNIPGIFGIINPPPRYTPPAYKPPKRVRHKPKKKNVGTARHPSPRTPANRVVQKIPQFIANEVTVLIKGSQPDGVDDALAQTFGLTKLSSVPITLLEGRLVRYAIPGNRPLPRIIAALTADPRVSMAQPNNIYLTVSQKRHAARRSAQYSFAKLSLEPAHKISQGRNVPVAVIDTGVDVTHPDLKNAVSQTFDAVGRGKASAEQHGTAIAGLIAGRGKVRGVAPQATLLAVRTFYMDPVYKRPVTSSAILLRALDWSFTNKARIFNMSFTGPYDPLVKKALESAYEKGVILVAAAGNGGPKAVPAYPAAYDQVIAITAVDRKDRLYPQANRGKYLAVAAPGVDVLVPSLKRGYRYSSGTSLAAAHISGLIALLLEKNPQASATDVREAITANARDLGPEGYDTLFGAGLVDAYASLLSLNSGQ